MERMFWKAVRPDFRTRYGYRWAFPGSGDVVEACLCPGLIPSCNHEKGLWVASTFAGASLGGHGVGTALMVGVPVENIRAESGGKARVSSYWVFDVVDTHRLLRTRPASGANLAGADLAGADLSWADLAGAYLSGANLSGANLAGANLSGAYGRDDWNDLVKKGGIR